MHTSQERADLYLKILSAITNATIIFSLLFAYLSYCNVISQQKRSASIDLIHEFNNGKVSDARESLYRGISSINLQEIKYTGLSNDLKFAIINKAFKDPSYPGKEINFNIDLMYVAHFFNTVDSCINEEICDEQILSKDVGRYGADFYCFFGKYIDQQGKNLGAHDLSDGLRRWIPKENRNC